MISSSSSLRSARGRGPRPVLARLLAALLASTLAACGATASYSPQPPELLGAPKLWVPTFSTKRLGNGIETLVNVDPHLPVVSIAIGIRGGSLLDGPGRAGLSSLLAAAMVERTQVLPRVRMLGLYDHLGARMHASSSPDGLMFQIQVLEDRLPEALGLASEILRRPLFDPGLLERLKAEQLASLEAIESNPSALGRAGLDYVLFGGAHPLGLPAVGTRSSLRRISVDDLAARHRAIVRPDNVVIVVAGRADPQVASTAIERLLGDWKADASGPTPKPAVAVPTPGERRIVHFVARPEQTQTTMVVGQLGPPRTHPDQPLVAIFAGRVSRSAGGWLRGVENLTYGVSSLVDVNGTTGIYGAQAHVDAQATGRALESLVQRYDAQVGGSFDVEKVVTLTQLGMPGYTIVGRARQQADLYVGGLPFDHWARLRARLDDMRSSELPDVFYDYAKSARMQIVLVGDPAVIKSQVPPLGLGELRELALPLD